jgi:hypothetical protein
MKFLPKQLPPLAAVAVFAAGTAFADGLVPADPAAVGLRRERLGGIATFLKNKILHDEIDRVAGAFEK